MLFFDMPSIYISPDKNSEHIASVKIVLLSISSVLIPVSCF